MKNIEVVLKNFSAKGIQLDYSQVSFLQEFLDLDARYKPSKFFFKNNLEGNLYLWGPVGRGKTLLLQTICESYFPNAGIFHFMEFMQLVHKNLSEFSGTSDPLLKVVKRFSKEYQVIFIDEFQIEDIADAMIIGTLIKSMVKTGTRIFLSSNALPKDLYKDGLQRSKFLKTIDFINKNFLIHNLIGIEDYRLREIAEFDSSNENLNNNSSIKKFLKKTFGLKILKQFNFIINGRKFTGLGGSDKILWISFDDFFASPCAGKDFIEIANKYEWVFINNFHPCNDDHLDKVRRFISFIDIVYQEKQKLKFFCNLELIQNLYTGHQLRSLWLRTASRVHQISTKKYLQNLEKN